MVMGMGVMLKVELVAEVSDGLAATRLYPLAIAAIDRSEKVAMPFTALTVVVPWSGLPR